ncbi:MAG: acetoacetate--CoA ligase [Gammaproteobacteria bacterium]|nr:acetoacetate--CoA ligase [Gammaproteobacteria bacterium]
MSQPPLMTPTAETAERSNLAKFMRLQGFDDYDALHAWSIEHREAFWQALWDFCEVVSTTEASRALQNGDDFLDSRWFQGAELNFAENLLRRRDDRTAVVGLLESGERQALTYAELHRCVARVATEFRERGVVPGDRIAGWLPNIPETVVCTLAGASIGAVWTSCSPDFGVEGALDRFGQTRPKLLIACNEYQYGGKTFDVSAKAEEVRQRIDSIKALLWTQDIQRVAAERREDTVSFEPRGFDDPLYVLYSSGTTGKPKCIVHGVGGTLLQHLKEHRLHTDLKPDDTLFYFTTCGWMMWNWLVSGLASGSAIVLYDGSPFHPRRSELIELIDAEEVSIFGVSAKYLSALQKFGVKPRESHRLTRLRSILSTGSPLAPESFHYVYRHFKEDVALASISGGTDIVSCFALGNPLLPVYPGELQSKGLGMAVEVFDEDGKPLPPGEKGELVCTKSFPSRPTGFWDDPDDAKFRAAYFERFDNVWAHGDFAEFTDHGGMIIHGRSDAVLNPGGVRIGTAEIYRQVDSIDAVVESVCVAQSWRDDVRIVLFVVLREGLQLDKTLRAEIRDRIRRNASPRHVPALVLQVNDVPRTMSGKIAELAVRDIIHGREPGNATVLANPEVLNQFRDVPSLGQQPR